MNEKERPWERVIWPEARSGDEPIGQTGATILDYWRWADSDLLSNTARGVLAEFLVARAVGDTRPVRDAWAAHDVTMPAGDGHSEIKIEVKSGGYLQSWKQPSFSRIQFSRLRSRGFNPETGKNDGPPGYHADVYVFAVHTCRDPDAIDLLDLNQWDFRVVSRKTIEGIGAKSLSWTRVQALAPKAVAWEALAQRVVRACLEPTDS